MKLTNQKQGELYIVLEAILWGFFPVIVVMSYYNVSPLISLSYSTLFSCIFFVVILTIQKKWHEITHKETLKDILLTTFILGMVYYFFYFFALRFTSPGNASLITLTEFFFLTYFLMFGRKNITLFGICWVRY